ncbi:MAG: MoxR family ATPase [Ruminococcus sp.]|nr:MoxR family ATPase [Ruminococcus sp.]MCM1380614.1 MoxR family ATPase [Muribaculaceae bacterium]MCM1479825.1 MoxR family ATPase [Muribaculaceae bacterium]
MTEEIIQTKIMPIAKGIIAEVGKAVIGKDDIIIKTLLAIISRGHILLDDIPGVGKTTMAVAFSKAMSLDYKRMQFTPDVLPADVTGFTVYNKQTGGFEYRPGAVLCSLFLADEINRTSSKTQSALLEAMEEGAVTVDGVTHKLPKPFTVIATQNPIGSVGTQMLPDSQLDRFIIKLTMGYPDLESEVAILKSKEKSGGEGAILPVAKANDILFMQAAADEIFVDDKVYRYIASLAAATRSHPQIKLGLSPRGTVALASMARAAALMRGRSYVIPEDVKFILRDVAEHRIILSAKAKAAGIETADIIRDISSRTPAPKI